MNPFDPTPAEAGNCPSVLVFRHYYFRCGKDTGDGHDEHEYRWSGRTADSRLVWVEK